MFYNKKKISIQKSLIHKFSTQKVLTNLFKCNKSILVAISGGQDSISLLFLFHFLQKLNNWKIGIVHCNHMWQSDAILNASTISFFIKELHLNYYEAISTVSIKNEADARLWRYQIITKIATVHGYEFVVTGHTASDNVETLLASFFRNCQLKTIKSRKKSTKKNNFLIKYLRPLLKFSRLETKLLCEKYNLPITVDVTNKNLIFKRNRIRNELLPYIRNFFNKNFDNKVFNHNNKWAEWVSNPRPIG